MLTEQRIRALLFYLSVIIFLMGLPTILSFTLGYKFDRRAFKFTKAGLIVLKTQPAGANIYLNNGLLASKTPTTINELLPGRYSLKIELEKYSPWSNDVEVQAGKVTRLERIILFPIRPNIKQLNKEKASSFLIEEERDAVYYFNPEEEAIYKSDLEGENFQEVSNFIRISPAPFSWKLSPDKEKLLYFNSTQVAVAEISLQKGSSSRSSSFVLNYTNGKIIDAFWHSDSYHLILFGTRFIEALEAEPGSSPVTLVTLNKGNSSAYYDVHTDTLYFLDSQKAADGNFYDNLYKLELNSRAFLLEELRKLKSYE